MFTSEQREKIRFEILERAKTDNRITGGAVTGSASIGKLDAWSDIDLAFGVDSSFKTNEVLQDYSFIMYESYGAIHHLDVNSSGWIYRVFLLENSLQVDLAFVSEEKFGARAPTFQLVFGKTGRVSFDLPTEFEVYVGWCWLYALHARSSLKRSRLWQAEFFISGLRDYLISLYCQRHSLPEKQGRGVDQLPTEILADLNRSMPTSVNSNELKKALKMLIIFLNKEISQIDSKLYDRLKTTLLELTD